ncbi:copper-transporting ATPase PAA1, chloroplastic [Quillaja saponaria]|uniref:Copper-transporting ATPase PAA1, chloroplastic n=1 Tax=Quillaja saponaria TaxID=32244 RepID=A0AAD7M1H6_QUISA|nr:copper-transporting ATPase PAA1, chloroplastic [Quillaja saponaria]
MESTLTVTTTQVVLFRALNRHFSRASSGQCSPSQLLQRKFKCIAYGYEIQKSNPFAPGSCSSLRSLCVAVPGRLQCISSSAASFASGAEDISPFSPDVIILDVTGMMCGGCAASVKRILESQPKVSSASVNLTTETAIVWPVSEAKVPNWQKQLGEALAEHLTGCGFKSNLRGEEATEGDVSP